MDSLEHFLLIIDKSIDEENIINCLEKIEETLSLHSADFSSSLAAEKLARVLEEHRETLNKYIRGGSSDKLVWLLFKHQELLDFDIKIKFLEKCFKQLSDAQLCNILEEALIQLETPTSKYPVRKTPAFFLLFTNIQDKSCLLDIAEKHKRIINTLLRDNIHHELMPKLFEILKVIPGFFENDVMFELLKKKFPIMTLNEKMTKLNEYITFLRMAEKQVAGEFIPTIALLFSRTPGNLIEEKVKFLIAAENHKDSLNHFLRTNHCPKLFSILYTKPEFIDFDVACKYIPKDSGEMLDIIDRGLKGVNTEVRNEARVKYQANITQILNYMGRSDNSEFMEIAEKNRKEINQFLRHTYFNPANEFFSKYLELLDFDVRVLQVTRNTNYKYTEEMSAMLEDGLKTLETEVDERNVELVLQSIGELLPPAHHAHYAGVRDRFVNFAKNNKSILNKVYRELAFSSFRPIAEILESNYHVLDFEVKLKNIPFFSSYMDVEELWDFQYKCLQEIMTAVDLQPILKYVRSIRNSIRRKYNIVPKWHAYWQFSCTEKNTEKFKKDEFEFAEKHKDLINQIMYEKLESYNVTIFALIARYPALIEKRNKYKFATKLLPILHKEEKWEMLEECLCELRKDTSDTAHLETGSYILSSIFPTRSLGSDEDHEKLKECSKKYEEEFKTLVSEIKNKFLTSRIMATLTNQTDIFKFKRKIAELRAKLDRYKSENIGMNAVKLTIDRGNVVTSSFEQTAFLQTEEWKRTFRITFVGEPGIDVGGLQKEWYTVLTREVFNPNYALFTATYDNNCYTINRGSQVNPDHLAYFSFVGRVIAKCIMERQCINCRFTKAFYKHILNIPVDCSDLERQDPIFFKSMYFMLKHPTEQLNMDLTFSTEVEEFGEKIIKDLVKNGRNIAVTDENKEEYVKLISQIKMTDSIEPQINAFRAGFYEVSERLSRFDEKELELLICGEKNIDIDDLRYNTKYVDCKESDEQVQWFWRALESFGEEDKAKFLMFVTGSPNAPLNGFADLRGLHNIAPFTIVKDNRTGNRLPTSHTCANQFALPHYDSYEHLLNALLLAIREGAEGYSFG